MTTDFDSKLLAILGQHVGSENAISWEDLTWALLGDDGMLDFHAVKVQVRETIERMRNSGEIIYSNQSGYYLPETEAEFNDFLGRYRNPALKIMRTAPAMDAGRSRYFAKQLTLDEKEGR